MDALISSHLRSSPTQPAHLRRNRGKSNRRSRRRRRRRRRRSRCCSGDLEKDLRHGESPITPLEPRPRAGALVTTITPARLPPQHHGHQPFRVRFHSTRRFLLPSVVVSADPAATPLVEAPSPLAHPPPRPHHLPPILPPLHKICQTLTPTVLSRVLS